MLPASGLNLVNPYWQISGAWARPISGKLIQSSILEFWPHDTGRFLENSSKIEHLVEKWYSKKSGAWHRPIFYKNWIGTHKKLMDGFSRNAPEIEISKKYWMSFPNRNPSVSHPGKLKFLKISGWVFQDLPIGFFKPIYSEKDGYERTMTIKNVYNHPMFRSDNGAPRHDIAILETTSDLYSQGSQSAPACIPPSDASLSDMTGAPGKCYVAGFGTTEWQGEASEELRSINVNIYNDRICQARLHGRYVRTS